MDHIDCYVTIHADESDLKTLQEYAEIPLNLINEPGTDTQQLITSQPPQRRSTYLVWDQHESVILVNPSTSSSIRYQLSNENDKEALSSQLSTHKFDSVTQQQESLPLPAKAKATKYALYLDLPTLQLDDNLLKVFRQVIVDSIQDQCSLTVLLNTAAISVTQQRSAAGLWSIQTEKQWTEWQTLLGLLYMTQVQVAYSQDSPLFDMTVMVLPLLDDDYMASTKLDFDTLFAVHDDVPILNAWNAKRQSARLAPFPVRIITSSPNVNTISSNTDGLIEKDHQLKTFDKVVVGGTFDHLHAGHKILLTMTALSSTRAMVVGVTDDSILQSKKHHEWIEPTEQRIEQVRQFCKKIRPDMIYDIVPIFDPYGPTITDPTIDALVCSQETLKGGHMVNDEREKRNYSILTLRVIDVISATSDSALGNEANLTDKISSTWIRNYLAQQAQRN
ncbi:hypothetical protein BCR42DRAFT_349782 [Absidia repens]|uniref:Cytidyltransferase-like domain-containing protein n=1 Tax=Absidia repens TaxID=90262 RepID=A0A1X2IML2_9FUNG|nr:hypothetical protein BCR42DRAFT_349782 [Absidia repens]